MESHQKYVRIRLSHKTAVTVHSLEITDRPSITFIQPFGVDHYYYCFITLFNTVTHF